MEMLKELIGPKSFLVLGVGNPEKGDDGIGNYIISKLRTKHRIDCGPMPENFTGKIRDIGPEIVLMIDAVDFGGEPGETIFTEAEKAEGTALSTHALPFSLFCKLLPDSRVYLLGIQPESLTTMSKRAKETADRLADELNRLLK